MMTPTSLIKLIGCAVAALAVGVAQAGLTEEVSIRLQGETPGFHQYLGKGWHKPDTGAAWTGKDKQDATIRIPVEPGFGYDVLVFPQIVPADRFKPPYKIQILVNGRKVRSLSARKASAMIEVSVPSWALEQDVADVALRSPLSPYEVRCRPTKSAVLAGETGREP